MKISRSLAAVALSGTLLLGGTTVAIAQIPDAADSMEGIGLPATIVVDGSLTSRTRPSKKVRAVTSPQTARRL